MASFACARQLTVKVVGMQAGKGSSNKGSSPTPDPFDRVPSKGPQYERANVRKGKSFSSNNRRRGRHAALRNPDDSPLRDGNRDRLIGLLTERAAKTLLVYSQETNPNLYHWLYRHLKENPIPLQGTWDEISGEAFLRKLLCAPATTTKLDLGRGELYDNTATAEIEPRQVAQRIMDIRVQLSKEFQQDLSGIGEENCELLKETLQVSFDNALTQDPPRQLPPKQPVKVVIHPELLEGGELHPEVAQSHPELVKAVVSSNAVLPEGAVAAVPQKSAEPAPKKAAEATVASEAAAAPKPPKEDKPPAASA